MVLESVPARLAEILSRELLDESLTQRDSPLTALASRVVLEITERARLARLRQVHHELGELIIARLGKLPKIARFPVESGDTMVVVHGSPVDPTEPFTHDMTDEQLGELLTDEPGEIIICGASHVPFDRQLDGVRIVNVGSVGEAPGGGVAHASIVETAELGIRVEQFCIPLDG